MSIKKAKGRISKAKYLTAYKKARGTKTKGVTKTLSIIRLMKCMMRNIIVLIQ